MKRYIVQRRFIGTELWQPVTAHSDRAEAQQMCDEFNSARRASANYRTEFRVKEMES